MVVFDWILFSDRKMGRVGNIESKRSFLVRVETDRVGLNLCLFKKFLQVLLKAGVRYDYNLQKFYYFKINVIF